VSGPADERWSERIRRAIPLVDALIWIAIAVGAVILATYLVEEQWGDAAQYLFGGVVTALFGWLLYLGWTKRLSHAADESELRTEAPEPPTSRL
jgi:uncharacterized membrane protein